MDGEAAGRSCPDPTIVSPVPEDGAAMARILVASCDLDALFDVEELDDDDEVVAAALRAVGVDAEVALWDDSTVDWQAADAVVIRSTWDYQDRRDEFLGWAATVENQTTLFPSADIVRWNTHKGYLMELEDRGAPIVPTAWLAAGDTIDLADLAAQRGWTGVVAKPVVGAGGHDTLFARDPGAHQDTFQKLVDRQDMMVQPLLEGIAVEGELSITCIDGRASHAVRKRPADGQWLIQLEHGGTYEAVELDPDLAALAEWIVAATGVDPVFARVDLVPGNDGSWQLGELELVEPALYLDWAPGSAERLVEAILARLDDPSKTD